MGAFNFVGTLASGWLTDRIDPRRLLLLIYYGFRGLSLFMVPLVHDQLGHDRFRRSLRPRLHRDGSPDRGADRRSLRFPERRDRLRLGVFLPSGRRGRRRLRLRSPPGRDR